jgi:hypothetical protein
LDPVTGPIILTDPVINTEPVIPGVKICGESIFIRYINSVIIISIYNLFFSNSISFSSFSNNYLIDIYYVILISIKLPFLYKPPNGTPAVAAAASSTKFKEDDT